MNDVNCTCHVADYIVDSLFFLIGGLMIVERKTHIPEDIDDDCISRKAVLALATELSFDGIKGLEHWKCNHIDPLKVMELPPVAPKKVCIAEIKVERDEVEQLIAEKIEEIKQAICSREMEKDGNDA